LVFISIYSGWIYLHIFECASVTILFVYNLPIPHYNADKNMLKKYTIAVT